MLFTKTHEIYKTGSSPVGHPTLSINNLQKFVLELPQTLPYLTVFLILRAVL